MENEILKLLRKRKENADKEATMAAIAGGIGSLLSGDAGGDVADYSAGLVKNRLDRGAAIDDQSFKYQVGLESAKAKAEAERLKAEKESNKKAKFKPALKPVFDEATGRTVLKYFTGPGTEQIPTGEVMGFAPKQFKNEEGVTTVMSPGAGLAGMRTYRPELPRAESGISPYFKNRSDSIADKFIAEKKKERGELKEAYTGYELLKLKGIMPTQAALNSVVKLSESGKMTDADRDHILKAVGKLSQLREAIREESDGRVIKRKTDEAKKIYGLIFDINNSTIAREAASRAKGFARSPKEYKYLLKKLNSATGLKSLKVPSRKNIITVTNGIETLDINISDKKAALKDGFKVVK